MTERTKREIVYDLRHRDALELAELGRKIRQAKAGRGARLLEVRAACRAHRKAITESAHERRARLRQTIADERGAARTSCGANREQVGADVLATVASSKARGAKLKANTRAEIAGLGKVQASGAGGRRAGELRAESDDEVKRDIERRFWPVWAAVKHQIKAGKRTTRSEEFADWMHDNSARVAELLHDQEEKDLRELIAQERKLAREVRSGARYRGHAATIASHDDWGG